MVCKHMDNWNSSDGITLGSGYADYKIIAVYKERERENVLLYCEIDVM